MKLIYNLAPYEASAEKDNRGDHRYRWISAKDGKVSIDSGFSRIINWSGPYMEINGVIYLVKWGLAPKGSAKRIWLDNAINKKLIENS